MACSSPAMEMDLSGRAGLLMREARDENSQDGAGWSEWSSSSSATSPESLRFPRGVVWKPEIAERLGGTRPAG